MKAVFKQKVNDVFTLKRTYFLLLLIIASIITAFLLEKSLNNYLQTYTIILGFTIMVPISYICSLFLIEKKKNTLFIFLKINKRKYKLYIFLILMLCLITTAFFTVVLFISLKTFDNPLKSVITSISMEIFSSILTLIFKKYNKESKTWT